MVIDPRVAYQLTSMMEGVIQRGTAIRLKDLGLPLAGKTGTTNKNKDAWFIGYSPDIVVGIYVGYDQPKTLGFKETGSSVAVPIFKNYTTNKSAPRKDMIPDKIYTSSSSAKYLIPPMLIGSSIFITSAYKSFNDTKIKNEELINIYIKKRIEKNPPNRFLDFSEPKLIYKK